MSSNAKKYVVFALGGFVVAGCLGAAPTKPAPGPQANAPSDGLGLAGGTAGGPGNTFDHNNDQIDPFKLLERVQEQGPPEISTKMHSCQKMKVATVGRVLARLGVNLGNQTAGSAGELYTGGAQAMGAPNYGARVAETIELTTAGATKLFDIFVQAAPEIIAAMPNQAACKLAGVATQMFDTAGKCTAAGASCLIGAPASQAQIDLCNSIVGSASTPQIGQTMAVASLLAAAHTCE